MNTPKMSRLESSLRSLVFLSLASAATLPVRAGLPPPRVYAKEQVTEKEKDANQTPLQQARPEPKQERRPEPSKEFKPEAKPDSRPSSPNNNNRPHDREVDTPMRPPSHRTQPPVIVPPQGSPGTSHPGHSSRPDNSSSKPQPTTERKPDMARQPDGTYKPEIPNDRNHDGVPDRTDPRNPSRNQVRTPTPNHSSERGRNDYNHERFQDSRHQPGYSSRRPSYHPGVQHGDRNHYSNPSREWARRAPSYHRYSHPWSYRPWGPCWNDWLFWDGRYYFWTGVTYSTWHYRYYWVQPEVTVEVPLVDVQPPPSSYFPVCFPPSLPPLGQPVPGSILDSDATPTELIEHLNEPFYSVLSTRLLEGSLFPEQRAELDSYRAEREAQLAQLRARLTAAESLPPEQRRSFLENFAQQQAAALEALDIRAEKLRQSLMRRGLGGSLLGSGDWRERQGAYFTVLSKEPNPTLRQLQTDILVLRGASAYQEGLGLEQRLLLREAYQDRQRELVRLRTGAGDRNADRLAYVSPSGAQLAIPQRLTDALATPLENYIAARQRERESLASLVLALERVSDYERPSRLRSFSHEQNLRLLSLEADFNAFRERAVFHSDAFAPKVDALFSESLMARIESLDREAAELSADYFDGLADLRDHYGSASIRMTTRQSVSGAGEAPPSLILGVLNQLSGEEREKARQEVSEFNSRMQLRGEQLGARRTGILASVAQELARNPTVGRTLTAEQAFERVTDQLASRRTWYSQVEYRVAVFVPGLSSAQRRLLFGAAMEASGLPLPMPE